MNRREALFALCSVPMMVRAADALHAVVYKTPTCGCCGLWVAHLQKSGFTTEVHNLDDLGAVKARVGIPYGLGSCHTAQIEDRKSVV